MSKNVLQFMCFRSPYGGSFFKSLLRLENTLKKNDGIEMIYLFHTDTSDIDWVQDLIKDGKKIYFLTSNFLKDILIIKKIIVQHNIRYLHAHFAGTKYFFLFKVVKMLYNKELFIIRHLRNHDQPRGIVNESLRKILNDIDLYIGCSESVAVEFRKNFKLDSKKVTHVTNAIDFERLDQFEELKREELGVDPQTIVFLMFGFDYHRKGVDIVLEAMNNLVNQDKNVCLLLSLSINRKFIESKITERFSEIPSWLKILKPRDDIASYYKLSNYFISAAREEGFCNALVESAYCERPIITSDIPGPRSLNIPHTYKFTSENVAELQKVMLSAISLTANRKKKITSDQKAYVKKAYNLDLWANQISGLYKKLKKNHDIIEEDTDDGMIKAYA
jgi:glycosyltransferase involved in cell wall biosynthesis